MYLSQFHIPLIISESAHNLSFSPNFRVSGLFRGFYRTLWEMQGGKEELMHGSELNRLLEDR
jgi:hypothetical protein